MNQKALITFLVVIIVILTGTAVYFATNRTVLSPQPSSSEVNLDSTTAESNTSVSETSTNTVERTKWSTFAENITGFSIQYPNGWPVRKPGANDCGENKICEVVFSNLPQGPDDTIALQNLINILIHSPGAIEGNGGGDGASNCSNIRNVALTSGLQAETKECINDMDGSRQYFYTFKKDGWWYQVISRKGSEAAKVFDDMANSFTFTR